LDLIELIGFQAGRRKDRLAVCGAILADDDIAAPKVLEVVGEGAQRPQDWVRVPTRLVLDAVTFNRPLTQ